LRSSKKAGRDLHVTVIWTSGEPSAAWLELWRRIFREVELLDSSDDEAVS
jgi:hypothetical protein